MLKVLKDRFFSTIQLGDDTDIVLEELVDVEMLRVGTFDHPAHGELDITEELLSSIKSNFDANTLKRDVSFDWNHNQKEASAWLRELDIIDGVLVGGVKFTKKGLESIEEEEYGYFSVEFVDDYTDAETGDKFGPTLTGGALTNRPFITDLKKIEFSNEDFEGTVFRLEEGNVKKKKKVDREPVVNKDLTTQLQAAEDSKKRLEEEIEDLKTKLEEKPSGDNKQLSDLVNVVRQMKEENKTLTQTVEDLKGNVSEKDKETRRLKVEARCDKFMSDDDHHPSVIMVAREIMLADNEDTKVVKLSEVVGEDEDGNEKTVEIELSVTEAIEKLLEAIPGTQRADLGEKTRTKKDVQLQEEAEDAGIKRSFKKKGLKVAA